MIDSGKNTEKTAVSSNEVADLLFNYVRDMIYKPVNVELDINRLPGEFENLGKGLEYLFKLISETRVLAKELGKGNLDCSLPPPENEIAAPLKTLHASLKHLTWQTQQISKGDYSQHVDFMGDFSIAFNNMTAELKRQSELHIDELQAALHEAQRAREVAEQASMAKTTFLAKMSHEIRTPLNAILGMTELVLREDNTPAAQDNLYTIKQAGHYLLSIISDILDFADIETGKLKIIPDNYLFQALIIDIINIIKTKIIESRLRFFVNIDSNIPKMLIGDVTRIRQIILNLLSNAAKYNKENGWISLKINSKTLNEDAVNLIIEVSDSGKGINQDEIPYLFDEFTQFDRLNDTGNDGTGLGLAITKSLAEAMNGTVSVISEYGKGSTFTALIPQAYKDKDKLSVVVNPQDKNVLIFERRELSVQSISRTMENLNVNFKIVGSEDEFYNELVSNKYSFVFIASVLYDRAKKRYSEFNVDAKFVIIAEFGESVSDRSLSVINAPFFCMPVADILNSTLGELNDSVSRIGASRLIAPEAKILIVDDININLKVAEGLLLPYQVKVDLCNNGADAVEAAGKTKYDIIFMDYMMPRMNGIETLEKIRGFDDSYYRTLPVLALSADTMNESEEMLLKNGFNDFLSKPIDVLKLNSILVKWLPKDKQRYIQDEIEAQDKIPVNGGGFGVEIEGVNTEKGLKMIGGDTGKYIKMLTLFYAESLKKINEIEDSLEKKDYSLYTTLVHGLKSSSAVIGAEILSEDAKKLEKAGNNKDFAYISNNNAKFMEDYKKLLEKIKEIIPKDAPDARNGVLDPVLLRKTLSELKQAIEAFDSVAINENVTVIKGYTRKDGTGISIKSILENILIGDHESAVNIINTLLLKI
jgi:signal transduction histidine kinase/CheY-like chemotaxis protein/HPt (histidine-containing phosphotransfer) domain-containing protein